MQFVKFLICTGPGKIEKYIEKEQGEGEKSRKEGDKEKENDGLLGCLCLPLVHSACHHHAQNTTCMRERERREGELPLR